MVMHQMGVMLHTNLKILWSEQNFRQQKRGGGWEENSEPVGPNILSAKVRL